ncbi:MAG: NAD(P)/FAD-dependent oxidoreductase [Clostridiales bacterium]|nr:NAD(P)/FAD-dependent oxidoreductase [Clostridiales bacterium]
MFDAIIIGGGPAGVQAALYTVRAGLSTAIICEKTSALQRAEKIENYYGLEAPISGDLLYQRGLAQAQACGAQLLREQVVGAEYGEAESFHIITENRTLTGRFLLIAVGSPRKTVALEGIERFTGRGVSYCATCDAFFYRGKEVAVLGNGAYALHEAAVLSDVAAKVTLLTNGDPAPSAPCKFPVIDQPISALAGNESLEQIRFRDGSALHANGLFIALGAAGGNELALKLGAMTQNGKILISETMETNIPNVFAAGDCTGGLLQISKAVCDGAKAGLEIVRRHREQKAKSES